MVGENVLSKSNYISLCIPFCTSKIYFFHFTHLFLQNTHISLPILHVYSNKIFISLPTQPPTYTHNPHRYHTGIHTTHRQKTRKTNPATRSMHPKSTQPSNTIHTIQQPEIEQTQQHNPHNPPAENQKNKPSNKIDAHGINTTQQHNPATRNRNKASNTIHTTHPELTPHLEQQDRHLWWRWREQETRSTPPKASGGDGERHSTPFNPKPTNQAHSTRKQRETKEERAIGDGSGVDGDRRKLAKERLMRVRKIDQMRGR